MLAPTLASPKTKKMQLLKRNKTQPNKTQEATYEGLRKLTYLPSSSSAGPTTTDIKRYVSLGTARVTLYYRAAVWNDNTLRGDRLEAVQLCS